MKSESTNRLAILFPLRRLLQIGMVGAWVGLVLGFLGRFYWAFDLCSHFYMQFAVIAFVGTIAWIGAVDKRILAIALVAWLMLLPSIVWFYIGSNSKLSFLGAMRITIDHALVSREVQVHDRHVGPSIGSDHFPIVIDIGF